MDAEIVVVGAGLAGLACAARIREKGRPVVVLDRSARPGGRVHSRMLGEALLDFGPVFVHGRTPAFRSFVLDAARTPTDRSPRPPEALRDWPRRIQGEGRPCHPLSFLPGTWRCALEPGILHLGEVLAAGLDVRFGTRVLGLGMDQGRFVLRTDLGTEVRARNLVLALALEQTRALLESLETPDAASARMIHSLRQTLALFGTVPSLSLMAVYDNDHPASSLPWDVCYPSSSEAVLMISHESSKRGLQEAPAALTIQARAAWSHHRVDGDRDAWTAELLEAAGDVLGPWAAQPSLVRAHRWSHARFPGGEELSGPLLTTLSDGQSLGMAGDLFGSGGGMEAAWLSGRALADQLVPGD